jgi:hypothetical protein
VITFRDCNELLEFKGIVELNLGLWKPREGVSYCYCIRDGGGKMHNEFLHGAPGGGHNKYRRLQPDDAKKGKQYSQHSNRCFSGAPPPPPPQSQNISGACLIVVESQHRVLHSSFVVLL